LTEDNEGNEVSLVRKHPHTKAVHETGFMNRREASSQFLQFNLTADIADDTDAEICGANRASNQFTGRVKPVNCSMPWLSANIRVIRGFNCGF
jgi:hypothetical protein